MSYKKIRKNRKFLSIVGLSIFSLSLTACSHKTQRQSPLVSQSSNTPILKTELIKFFDPVYEISLPGTLMPFEQVTIYAKVPGFVRSLYVDRGSKVRKGQLLAVLEAPEMEQKYLSDKSSDQKVYSDYLFRKQAYERLLNASKTAGAVSAIELEKSESSMQSARSAYLASKSATSGMAYLKNYLRITAPFDGMITDRNVSVGALVGTGGVNEPLFILEQGSRLRLTVSLPEKDAASVKVGMPATYTISSQPGKVFKAILSRTSGLVNEEDHSLTLEFDINNSSGEIQGGDYAQVNLKLRRKDSTYWVPFSSILNTQTGNSILISKGGVLRKVPVKMGRSIDSLSEVFGNLNSQDSIIINPPE